MGERTGPFAKNRPNDAQELAYVRIQRLATRAHPDRADVTGSAKRWSQYPCRTVEGVTMVRDPEIGGRGTAELPVGLLRPSIATHRSTPKS